MNLNILETYNSMSRLRSNQNFLEGINYDEISVIIDDICKN